MASLSQAARLKAMTTAACMTRLSRQERVRVHVPNKAGSGQAAWVNTWLQALFAGAGMATAVSVGQRNGGGVPPLSTPPPLPRPLTCHTTRAGCLALTSLGLHCQMLLLL